MFRNYLAAALRNLVRNRLYAAINVIGLIIGFTAAMLIGLFVHNELTYDTWFPAHRDVYRVAGNAHPPGNANVYTDFPGTSIVTMLRQDLPELIAAARLQPQQRALRRGDIEANEAVVWADAEIFDVLPFHGLDGDLKSALQSPDSIVLTKSIARKYFGRENVVGETLEVDRQHVMRITAVLDDPPARSHLNIHVLLSGTAPFSPFANKKCCGIAFNGPMTYARLEPGTLSAVQAALPAISDHYIPGDRYGLKGEFMKASEVFAFDFQPLAAIHMVPQAGRIAQDTYGVLRPAGDANMVSALLITGVLIVLVASANFINLMTARANRRAVEVGVRKTSGAERRDLILQFSGETLLYVVAAMVAATVIAWITLPAFGAFLGRAITLDFSDPRLGAGLAGLVLVVAALAGVYPALVLSAFRPAVTLSGQNRPASSRWLRQGLVTLQFAALSGLIVATMVIERQTRFAMGNSFRLDTDQLLFIATPCGDAFKNKVAQLPGVRGAACSREGILGGVENVGLTTLPDGTHFNLYYAGMDPGLLELYGLKPLAGRLLLPSDVPTPEAEKASRMGGARRSVINEATRRALGFSSPIDAIGHEIPDRNVEIVGVVPDFPLRSLRDPINAMAFVPVRTFSYLAIKLDGATVGETLQAIDRAWEETGADHPILRQFYDQHVQDQYIDIVRQSNAFTAFSAAATFIACLGLFGLSAFTAEQRTKEIGVRKAMGARTSDVLRLLVWQFVKPVLLANALAWPVGYLAMRRWLESFAYHIDLAPWMFLAASVIGLSIAIATVLGHALLVARTQPVAALRYE